MEARAHLERLLKLDPNNDDARLALAHVLWRVGLAQDAQGRVGEVLARHPQHQPALALRRQLVEGAVAPTASRLRPQARVGVAAVVDTNLGLDPDVVERASKLATLAQIEASGGVVSPTLSGFLLLSSAIPMRDAAVLGELAPTRVAAEVVARYPAANFEAAVDLRYEELFANAFSTRLQRTVGPSVWGTLKLLPMHHLRLLAGVDLRQPVADFGAASIMPKVSLRDNLRLGRLSVTSDVAARMSRSAGATGTDTPLRTDFEEAALALATTFALSDEVALTAVVEGQGRRFRDDPTAGDLKETTLFGLAGARYVLDRVELHAEYAYTRNLSHRLYAYDRHQVSMGVRAWYE
ncbi:MAG: tetratricopeptide repeat protein [Deltaproteobacteria bacterium]|nr:tetratricopeptide repeat protein [Deltaproteobacteria bacterium]